MRRIAGPYDAEYVFGDSLSDNGNLAAALGTNFPDPPSYHDSFTNGPVSVQLLAQSLGLSLNPSLWTTLHPPSRRERTTPWPARPVRRQPAMGRRPSACRSRLEPSASTAAERRIKTPCTSIMIGGNDVRDAALYQTGTDATDAITAGVQTEVQEIKVLSGEGAKDFLVVNVPNVGIIPEFAQDNPGDAANATAYSISYDSQLSAGLEGLGLPRATGSQTSTSLLSTRTSWITPLLRVYEHDAIAASRAHAAYEPRQRRRDASRTARTSRASCIGTTSTRRPTCRPCGPRVSGRRFPSLRPGRCCCSASPEWALRDTQARERRNAA